MAREKRNTLMILLRVIGGGDIRNTLMILLRVIGGGDIK